MMKSPVALVVGLLVAAPAGAQELNAISKVDVQGDGQKATITVVGSRRPTFQAYTQKAPARVVVDFVKSSVNMPLSTPRAAGQLVTEVRATQMGTAGRELARLEFVFADEIDYTVDADGNALKLSVTRHARPSSGTQAVAGENGAVANTPAATPPVTAEVSAAEVARAAQEKAAEAEKVAREKAEREKAEAARIDAERKAEAARVEAEKARVEAEAKAAEARVEAEKARVARETAIRQEQERLAREAAEKAEKARIEQERMERERVARETAEKARVEAERKERERLDREKAEAARVEAERAEKARLEREKAEKAERIAQEAARAEQARLERVQAEQAAKAEKERVERERAEKARLERDRAEQEKAAREQAKAQRAEEDRLARLKADVAAAEGRKSVATEAPASGTRHAGSAADAPAQHARDEDDGFGGSHPASTPAPAHKPAPVAGRAAVTETSHAEEGGGGGGSGPKAMTFVGFKNAGEQSQVVVRTNDKVTFNVRKVGQNKVAIELDNTRILLRNNQRSLDTSFFPRTAVKSINPEETSGSNKGVKVIIELSEEVPFESKQEGNIITVSFQRPAG